jgi:hypothetical protein
MPLSARPDQTEQQPGLAARGSPGCRGSRTQRYGELPTGSYDCLDRVVLNAYYPLGHSPGGFRTWWRRWHGGSDADLDDAHLMRLPGRFARGGSGPGRKRTASR